MALTILHLDDEELILERFAQILQKGIGGRSVQMFSMDNVDAFTQKLKAKQKPDIILIDVHLDGQHKSGLELAEVARQTVPDAVILMVSSAKDVKTIRSSLKVGADDFVSKDVKPGELVTRIEAALDHRKNGHPQNQTTTAGIAHVAGGTIATIKLRVPAIINSAVNCVYVEGESGTGKEVVANLFAACLPKGVPFVRLNCGAIAPTLLTSELFGHTKGAFTGANHDKAGLIESADGGWIFLDEVATLPTDAQISLLRAIDNQAIRRVGANGERPVQFRVISATNEPLHEMVESGKFRRDLWQRLRETHITLPPLRARKHEIPELIDYFLSTMRGGPYQLAPAVQDALTTYEWPEGNIRELRNCLRAMTEKAINGVLTPKSIPEHIWDAIDHKGTSGPKSSLYSLSDRHSEIRISWSGERPPFETLANQMLLEILRTEFQNNGSMSLRSAGKALGIPKSTIGSKLKSLVEAKLLTEEELQQMMK